MNCEGQVKPFYLNFSSRPTINKQKAQKLDLKKWEFSLLDFKSKEPLESYKDLCKKKMFPKKIFFDKPHKTLKRKSISDKNMIETDLLNNPPICSFDQSLQNRKNTTRNTDLNIQAAMEKKMLNDRCDSKFEQIQCVFSENSHKSLKSKCMLNHNGIETHSLRLNSRSTFLCSFSLTQSQPQKEKKINLRQNPGFNICNIEATFEKKPLQVRCTNVLLYDSNPNIEPSTTFAKVKDLEMDKINDLEIDKIKDLKKLSKNNFIIPEDFFPDKCAHTLLKSAVNISSTGSVGFKTAEYFIDTTHQAVKMNHQDFTKNMFKADLMSTLSAGPIGVGSNWIHSIEQTKENHLQFEEKKKIQNLLAEGYCEQILKFQRHESSEKAIIEHRKGFSTTSIMRIKSIIHDYEIVVAECCVLEQSTDKLTHEAKLNEGSTYIAFFQKSSFYKQCMKSGKSFILSPPWYLIHLKCPVLICKYFKGLSKEQTLKNLPNKENLMKSQSVEPNPCNSVADGYPKETIKSKQKEDIFLMLKGRINLSAKIQRIWDPKISDKRLTKLLNDQKMYRLLLQTRNGNFYLLNVTSHQYLDWLMSVEIKEGYFYFFENLNISHRLEKRRHPSFFKYLQHFSKEYKVTGAEQKFVYQLLMGEVTKKPSKVIEADSPPFLSCFHFQSLSNVIKSPSGRASCKVNVLLQYHSVLYVSDESIYYTENMKYVKVFLIQPAVSFPNSGICITDALVLEGNLYLDEYSKISCLPCLDESLPALRFGDGQLQLRRDSSVADIAIVKGHVINVDETNACIWLQCSFCMNENLMQNTNEVIFCEDCCLVVSQPVLKVKMIVTVASEALQNVLLNIKLLSSTIKRILSLKENSYHPQCDVSDVLGKEIGPLLCYVKGKSHTLFYLDEVKDHWTL